MRYLLTSLLCLLIFTVSAFRNGDKTKPASQSKTNIFKQNCAQATAQSDLNVNNVRATLLVGGDLWWDGSDGGYIVPQVAPGEPEVSAIFAGAIWMGGLDPAGNLKMAAQQYGTSSGASDYWPGPLSEFGFTEEETCSNWDRIFTVRGEDIDLHIAQFAQSIEDGIPYDVSTIPNSILEWPARGNEFFFDIAGFELPDASQGLAPYWDENGDALYNPRFGDYPVLQIRGCSVPPIYPDEMKFWIFNDAGNIHTESGGDILNMEIQAQSFAFATADAVNDMTFTRYKLINRAYESLEQAIFGFWLDPDLGCSEDDYVGCDTLRNLMYVYNQDAIDGASGQNCNGVPTYGDKVPYLGVDFLQGPLAPKKFDANGDLVTPAFGEPFDTIVDAGMGSFIYFNRTSATTNSIMTAPNTPLEYYNYLNGRWLDGTPMTLGGDGLGGTEVTKYAFHDEPTDEEGWSMCAENSRSEDRKTVFSSNPFRLDPGQVNELIIGVSWVPDVTYPCPDMGRLFEADDLAQGMFDSCFEDLITTATTSLEETSSQLDKMNVYPNPAIASSNVSITNVPPQSMITIYSIEGRFVKQIRIDRNVQAGQSSTVDWDMTSTSGTSIANGTYMIHVQTEGVGERVLKLVCIK